MEKMFTVEETAKALRVSPTTIRRVVRMGDLLAIRIGTGHIKPRIVISETELQNFIVRRGIFCGGDIDSNEGKI